METATVVFFMLLYAVPGYILLKTKAIKQENISSFSKVLLFVCQPCLSLYSFQKVIYSTELFENMLIFLGLSAFIQISMLSLSYLVLRKKYDNAKYRVATIATTFGNVGFLGVPLLEALLPQNPEAVTYSAVFIVTMNLISWTLGSAILTGDRKYISTKKLFINPAILTLIVALPLFFTQTVLPTNLMSFITLLGKMTTPLSMLILGMRFATVKSRELFTDLSVYMTAIAKLVIFPLFAFLLTHFLPLDFSIKATLFILCCCPTASVVLNLSELYNCGQKNAANAVLVSTIFSLLSIPLLLMIL
jgi:predicted permease